jgi:hypothetical protein
MSLILLDPHTHAGEVLESEALVRMAAPGDRHSRDLWRISRDFGSTWRRLPKKAAAILLHDIRGRQVNGRLAFDATILAAVPEGFVTWDDNCDATALVPDTEEGRAWISEAERILAARVPEEEEEEAADLWADHCGELERIGGRWL